MLELQIESTIDGFLGTSAQACGDLLTGVQDLSLAPVEVLHLGIPHKQFYVQLFKMLCLILKMLPAARRC